MKRGRKRSWVGVEEEEPYGYLREAMVSGLMDEICGPQEDRRTPENAEILVTPERRDVVLQAVGTWGFSAHEYSEDELLLCAITMLQHALTIPDLEAWRISTENLTNFLIATRTAYNSFVPYHNFRHAVDVLQAVFYFLLQLGILPYYSTDQPSTDSKQSSPIASLLRPFDALTLLITAIGHDVGHPGVNNAFLVTLKAPLAQLYNDRSVLESFHCAAFSQLLRRYWPAAFQEVDLRNLLINSILATDMGLHFEYMKKMGYLQEKLHENGNTTDGWDGRYREEQRTLACSLLIKCADISNVARKYAVAAKWAVILTDEFARQADMETDLGIPSALFAPPVRNNIIELGKSQIGFTNLFALPLFQGVTDVLPGMHFTVDEINTNKQIWQEKISEANETKRLSMGLPRTSQDGLLSPRSGSIASFSGSPEQHPPETMTPPNATNSPQQEQKSHFSPITQADTRPNSIGTFGHPALHSPDESRRSSVGSPRSIASPQFPDLNTSTRSSGAFPNAILTARSSSNIAPSQLAQGLRPAPTLSNPQPNHSKGQADTDDRKGQDPKLVTMVVGTSPTKELESNGTSPSKVSNHSLKNRYESMSSTEEPSNGTTYPYSPLSGQTSVMSSSEKLGSFHGIPKGPRPVTSPMGSAVRNGISDVIVNESPDSIPGVKHRTSRFRLNFWKSKKRSKDGSEVVT